MLAEILTESEQFRDKAAVVCEKTIDLLCAITEEVASRSLKKRELRGMTGRLSAVASEDLYELESDSDIYPYHILLLKAFRSIDINCEVIADALKCTAAFSKILEMYESGKVRRNAGARLKEFLDENALRDEDEGGDSLEEIKSRIAEKKRRLRALRQT